MACLLNLPTEILSEICSLCLVPDLKNLVCCSSVCKDVVMERLWRDIYIEWGSLLHIDWRTIVNRKKRGNLKYAKNIKFVGVLHRNKGYNMKYKLKGASRNYKKILDHCNPNVLQLLQIHHHGLSVNFPCQLLKGLKKLDVAHNDELTPDAFMDISKLDFLVELKLTNTAIDDNGLQLLSNGLCKLKQLDLSMSRYISDKGFSCLTNFTELEKLNLDCCSVTDAGLSHVGNLSLQHLAISDAYVTDAGLKILCNLKILEQLDISGCDYITDISMRYVSTLLLLRSLNVSRTHVTDSGVSHLCSLIKLQELGMFSCNQITDIAMQHIGQLPSLESLDITYDNITDAGLNDLLALPYLKTLKCSHTQITDAVLCPLDDKIDIEWAEW